jgi:hypothetical protein
LYGDIVSLKLVFTKAQSVAFRNQLHSPYIEQYQL